MPPTVLSGIKPRPRVRLHTPRHCLATTTEMAAWYLQILWTHVGCVIASGSLFFTRGCMMLAGWPAANHMVLRRISVAIDSLLLAAAIALTMIIHQYPFVQAWLTVKVVLLAVYIVLGVFAFRRGRTRAVRAACFAAALVVFLFIVSVARAHDPLGIFTQL
ncbi:MAG TPA: SirB2 family protein [Rhodanobacteraceae bacterium]|nr:SirB2 family protein [Rhodanobacteraceae bacterium]